MNVAELDAYFRREFPSAADLGFAIVSADPDGAEIVLDPRPDHLRPGGVVSGPTLMALADTGMYASLLARLGPAAQTAVTSSLEMHFLRRARPVRLRVVTTLLKVGRRMAVGSIDITDPAGERVAHATVTYALPDAP